MWFDVIFLFFNDTATTEIYTLSLHDALPILPVELGRKKIPIKVSHNTHSATDKIVLRIQCYLVKPHNYSFLVKRRIRSEEHTSELQSRQYLVCRLLLEKKKT